MKYFLSALALALVFGFSAQPAWASCGECGGKEAHAHEPGEIHDHAKTAECAGDKQACKKCDCGKPTSECACPMKADQPCDCGKAKEDCDCGKG